MSSRQRKGVVGGSVDNSIHHFRIWVGNRRINDAARNTRAAHSESKNYEYGEKILILYLLLE